MINSRSRKKIGLIFRIFWSVTSVEFLNPLMLVVTKRYSKTFHTLKRTCTFYLQVCLSIHGLLLPPRSLGNSTISDRNKKLWFFIDRVKVYLTRFATLIKILNSFLNYWILFLSIYNNRRVRDFKTIICFTIKVTPSI